MKRWFVARLVSGTLLVASPVLAGRVAIPSVDSNAIALVDDATDTVERTLAVTKPYIGCAFSKDGARIYCSPVSGGLLDGLSSTTGETIWSMSTPVAMPADVAASPIESVAYVLSDSPAGLYVVTDFGTYAGSAFVPTGDSAASLTDLAISPDGRVALFGDLDNDKLWRVDLGTNTIASVTPPGMLGGPGALAFSHDGRRVYADELSTGVFRIWDSSLQTDLGTRVGCGSASRMALSNDGRKAYVTCATPSGIRVIDLEGTAPTTAIPITGMLLGVAVALDDHRAYTCDSSVGSTAISAIETFGNSLATTISGPTRPGLPSAAPDPTWPANACVQAWQGAPAPRHGHRLAWDSLRSCLVLFGGESNGSILGDSWEWRSGSWMRVRPLHSPGPRQSFAMTFDPVNQVTVLFGGDDGARPNGETWTRDAADWHRMTPATSPRPSSGASMAFLSRIGKCVLHIGSVGSFPQETWFWDGSNWAQSPAGGPSSAGQLVTDSWRDQVALFNGTGLEFFDGTSWSPGPALPAGDLVTGSFGFDEETGLFVLTGTGTTGEARPASRTGSRLPPVGFRCFLRDRFPPGQTRRWPSSRGRGWRSSVEETGSAPSTLLPRGPRIPPAIRVPTGFPGAISGFGEPVSGPPSASETGPGLHRPSTLAGIACRCSEGPRSRSFCCRTSQEGRSSSTDIAGPNR